MGEGGGGQIRRTLYLVTTKGADLLTSFEGLTDNCDVQILMNKIASHSDVYHDVVINVRVTKSFEKISTRASFWAGHNKRVLS